MPKDKQSRISATVVGVAFSLLAAFGSLVWACANGSGRITKNEVAIVENKQQLGRIELLTVAIAQKLSVDVSGLFKPK